jgi:hypothetical protein
MRNADQLFLHGRSIAIPSENVDGISGRFNSEATRDHIHVTPDGDRNAAAGGCIPCSRPGSARSFAAGRGQPVFEARHESRMGRKLATSVPGIGYQHAWQGEMPCRSNFPTAEAGTLSAHAVMMNCKVMPCLRQTDREPF